MKRQSDFQAEIFIRERKRNNRLRRAVALLCAVVMLLTMNSLKMSADTLEHIPGCGLEEHKHTLACYPLLCPLAEAEPQYEIRRAFIGDLHPHIHSEDCYDDNGVLACGYVESLYYHVHSRWCYDDDGNLVCGLNEIRPHQHTEACYQDVPTLACGQDEYPAHHHTEECYFTVRELACGLEENPGHIHTDACYYDHNELTCGLEESVGHVHTSECYVPVVETTCGMEEGPGHIHTEECYTRELICGELESEDHQHTDECYADVLTCEIPEGFGAHTHTESCYTVYNILVCGIPEGEGAHRHTIDCVTSYHTLICGIPEGEGAHTHTDNCYINYDYLVCGQEETEGHTHTEECYVHTQELICGEQDGSEWAATMLGQEGVQVHTHTDECFTTFTRTLENGEQRTLRFATCGYVEIPTITSRESDWTSYPVQISEGHTHTAACYDLDAEPICGMVEHEHTDACYQTRPVKTEAPAEGELIPAEGGNGDADSADLADLTEGTDSENGENETNDTSDDLTVETNADGDLDEGENETPVNNDENETADQEQTEAENLEQTEVGNDEDNEDVNAPAVDELSDNEDADTADSELTDGESSNNEAADITDGEPTDGEPTDNEPADITDGEPADDGEPTDNEPADIVDGEPADDGEPTDNEPADITDGEPTDNEPADITDGEPTDNEPADIVDGEPADDGEPTDNEPADITDGEISDNEPADITDGELTDDGEPTDNEPADTADGEPADDGELSDNEPADTADGESTDGDEETRRGDVASPAEDAPADSEPTDNEPVDTVDGELTDGEPADGEPEDGEPTDEEPVEFTAGERVIEVKDGSVTLAWGPEAEIPEDVRVEVVEIERGTPDYDILYNNAMAVLSEKKDTETTTQVMRFFDITLYDGEEKFEPKAAISVTVKVDEAGATENDEDVDAIHMEDVGAEAEVVEATTDSDTVSFEAESFSIYGVVVDVPATEAEEPPVSVAVDLSSVDLMAAAEVTDTVALSIPELLAGTDENAVKVEGELGVDPEALQEAKVSAPEGVQVDGDKLVLSADALESGVVSLEVTTYATEEYETIATTHKVDIELSDYQGRTDVAEGENITVTAMEDNSLPADATVAVTEMGASAQVVDAPAEVGETEGDAQTDEQTDAQASDEEAAPAEAELTADAEAEQDQPGAAEDAAPTVGYVEGSAAYDITITNGNEDVISETGLVKVVLMPENLNIYGEVPSNAVVQHVSYTLIHEHEGETTELPVDVEVDPDGTVTKIIFDAENFSTSTLYYTVDFTYVDEEGNEHFWQFPGTGSHALREVLAELGIQGEIISNATLTLIEQVDEVGEFDLYLSQDLETEEWFINSDAAFDDTYELAVTLDDVIYRITVTDAQDQTTWRLSVNLYGSDGTALATTETVNASTNDKSYGVMAILYDKYMGQPLGYKITGMSFSGESTKTIQFDLSNCTKISEQDGNWVSDEGTVCVDTTKHDVQFEIFEAYKSSQYTYGKVQDYEWAGMTYQQAYSYKRKVSGFEFKGYPYGRTVDNTTRYASLNLQSAEQRDYYVRFVIDPATLDINNVNDYYYVFVKLYPGTESAMLGYTRLSFTPGVSPVEFKIDHWYDRAGDHELHNVWLTGNEPVEIQIITPRNSNQAFGNMNDVLNQQTVIPDGTTINGLELSCSTPLRILEPGKVCDVVTFSAAEYAGNLTRSQIESYLTDARDFGYYTEWYKGQSGDIEATIGAKLLTAKFSDDFGYSSNNTRVNILKVKKVFTDPDGAPITPGRDVEIVLKKDGEEKGRESGTTNAEGILEVQFDNLEAGTYTVSEIIGDKEIDKNSTGVVSGITTTFSATEARFVENGNVNYFGTIQDYSDSDLHTMLGKGKRVSLVILTDEQETVNRIIENNNNEYPVSAYVNGKNPLYKRYDIDSDMVKLRELSHLLASEQDSSSVRVVNIKASQITEEGLSFKDDGRFIVINVTMDQNTFCPMVKLNGKTLEGDFGRGGKENSTKVLFNLLSDDGQYGYGENEETPPLFNTSKTGAGVILAPWANAHSLGGVFGGTIISKWVDRNGNEIHSDNPNQRQTLNITIHNVEGTPKVGMLKLEKVFDDRYIKDKLTWFTFKVKLENATPAKVQNKSFPASGQKDDKPTVDFDANGEALVLVRPYSPVTITNLPEGTTYTVTEVETAESQIYDHINTDNGQGTISAGATAQVVVHNDLPKTGLTLKKTVQNSNAVDQAFNFMVYLWREDGEETPTCSALTDEETAALKVSGANNGLTFGTGEQYEGHAATSAEFTLNNKQYIVIEGLPQGTRYAFVETNLGDLPAGYAVVTTDGKVEGQLPGDSVAEIVNEYKVNVSVEKTWEGGSAPEGAEVVVQLYRKKKTTAPAPAPALEPIVGPGNSGSSGSGTTEPGNGETTEPGGGETTETVSASVKISWDDSNNQDGSRPSYVTATLSNGQTATLNAGNGWEATINDLPKYNNGTEINYTWSGAEVSGYTVTSSQNGATTTLTYTVVAAPTESSSITGTLTYRIKNASVNNNIINIAIQNYNYNGQGWGAIKGYNIGQTTYLSNIQDGTDYTVNYVSEKAIEGFALQINNADNVNKSVTCNGTGSARLDTESQLWILPPDATFFELTYSQRTTSADTTLQQAYASPLDFLFPMAYAEESAPTNVVVNAAGADAPPSSSELEEVEGHTDPITLNAKNDWDYTWSNLPAYDSDGTAIEYYVVEKEVRLVDASKVSCVNATYTRNVDTNGNTQVSIENDIEWNKGDLEVSKTTNGNAGETDKAFHFTVTLTNRTGLSGTYGDMTFTNGVAQFTLANGQSATATNLPVGTTYTVVETEADAYGYVTTVTSSGTVDGKTAKGTISSTKSTAAFVNTKDTFGDIELTKTVSGDDPDENKAFTFTVTIKKDKATDTSFNGKYGDATFTAGVAEITVKASDTAAKKITGLPNGTEYEIVESDYSGDGYAQGTVTGALSGTIVGGVGTNSKVEITVDNVRSAGDLEVSKTTNGNAGETDKEFHFTVTLTNRTSLSGTYGGMNFTNGVAQFTLANGQSATATNLPVGTTYTVVEAEADAYGYVTTVTSSGTVDGKTAKGTISSTKSTAAFVNTKDTYGDIELKKTVSGDDPDEDKEFTFTVTIKKNGDTDTNFSGKYGDATFTAGVATLVLKASDTVAKKIENLPNGTEYEIVESDYSGDGYAQGTVTGKLSGTIVGGVGTNSKVEITVDNVRSAGGLEVSKTTNGNAGDLTKAFKFTVTLTNRTSLSGTYGGMTFTNGVAEFTLTNGQSKTATNLPVGTTYTVVEAEADQDGYVTTVTSNGTVVADDIATGTISSTSLSTAAFVNTKDTFGDIELKKTVSGTNADKDKAFTFTVTIKKDKATDTSFSGEYGDATFTEGVAQIIVKASDSAAKKITGLPNGTEYEIVENDYLDEGYKQGKVTGALSGTIVGGVGTNSKVEITVDNEYVEGKLIVTKQLKKGGADFHAQKKESFKVGLYQKDESDEWVAVQKNGSAWTEIITIEENDIANTVTFEPLDVGRDGKTYRVYELDDADNKIESGKYHEYTVTYDQKPGVLITRTDKEGTTTVTNTLDTTEIKVDKKWFQPTGDDVTGNIQHASITVKLTDGTNDVTKDADGNNINNHVTLDGTTDDIETTAWSYTWTNLPKYAANGNEIAYQVVETAASVNNVEGSTPEALTPPQSAQVKDQNKPREFTLINTLPTTGLDGTKTWVTTSSHEAPTLTLKRISARPGATEETVNVAKGQPVWTGEGNTLTYTYSDLPKYDDYGYLYAYSVVETGFKADGKAYTVEGGVATVEGGPSFRVDQTGNDIVNTELTDVTGTKVWKDFSGTALEPSTVNVSKVYLKLERFKADGTTVARFDDEENGYKVGVLDGTTGGNESPEWTYNWNGLDKSYKEEDGTYHDYEFKVTETLIEYVDGTEVTLSDGADKSGRWIVTHEHTGNAWTVTNTLNETDVTFTKAWYGPASENALDWPMRRNAQGEEEYIPITVTLKRWIDADETESQGERQFDSFEAKFEGLTPDTTTLTAQTNEGTVTLTRTGDTSTYTFNVTGLRASGTINGVQGDWEYRIIESQVDGYTTKYFKQTESCGETELNGATSTVDHGIIHNTIIAASLPATGGMGTTTIYIAGASLLILAVLGFIWLNRKKRDDGAGI